MKKPSQSHPRLSTEEMQRLFNEGGYWDRLKSGEYTEHEIEYHPNTIYPEVLARHQGAESVTVWWRDADGNDVAQVHYFKMPDGTVIPGKHLESMYLQALSSIFIGWNAAPML